MSENRLETAIVTIGKFLEYDKLHIPEYQRPYKWTTTNVIQLLEDIDTFRQKTSYRIGTVVIHDDDQYYNIVDGQQRTITLVLLTKAIVKNKLTYIKQERPELAEQIEAINNKMIKPLFANMITFQNIQTNYKELERRVMSLDIDFIDFLYNKCELTQFVLKDVSEAFQFFDSQNARGKDLEPHDLLKAYHLREFSSDVSPKEQEEAVDTWEDMETEELATLFSDFLYRIKGWSKGNSSRYFLKKDVHLFKGINLAKIENYPFVEVLKISDSYASKEGDRKPFPFQLDQIIINGKRFFEMINHYKSLYDESEARIGNYEKSSNAKEILTVISNYEGKDRIGDRYVRMLFDCALVYYIDKFGEKELSYAIEKIFVWAYYLRLTYYSIQIASVDNYVIERCNIFKVIRDAFNPREVISMSLPELIRAEIKSTKTEDLETLLIKLKYYV